MIQVYTGVPGAGKSYKMVLDLKEYLEKVEKKNAKASDPSEVQNFTVIANIRGLNNDKLPHINFDEYIMECFPQPDMKMADRVEQFFSYEYQKALNEKFGGPILYVIDECQLYFPRGSKLPRTEAYFQRHRHLGHYVFLATQTLSRSVNANLVALIEIEYTAVRRSFSFMGEFRYQCRTPGVKESFNTLMVRPKQEIFDLYTSFEAAEIKKPRKELMRKLMIPLLIFPICGYLFFDGAMNKDRYIETMTGKKPTQSSQPSAAASNAGSGQPIDQSQLNQSQAELNALRAKLEEKERVFLSVVLVGGKKMTIDPETNAYVEVKTIKHRVICSGDEGLNCYFDRQVNTAVRVAGANGYGSPYPPSSPSFSHSNSLSAPPKTSSVGQGSFVDSDLVPEPDVVAPKHF